MAKNKLTCNSCSGIMAPYTGPRHSKAMGCFLIVAGIFCILFWVGAVLGIPLLIIGLYMTGAKRQLWVCQECHMAIERVELTPKSESENKIQPSEEYGRKAGKVQSLSDI